MRVFILHKIVAKSWKQYLKISYKSYESQTNMIQDSESWNGTYFTNIF